MLVLENFSVRAGDKEIVKGVNLTIKTGEIHILFGPNGSGKSTLLAGIMGFPGYRTSGKIEFMGKDISSLPLNERAKLGIGIAFQHPPQIKGVRVEKLLSVLGGSKYAEYAEELRLTEFLDRDFNVGFSGGERKRLEVLMLAIQSPKLFLLDEPTSGVDLDNVKLIANFLKKILVGKSALIITHTGYILNYLPANKGHVMMDGRIVCHERPKKIYATIEEHGYNRCLECARRI